jgi:hypothetical protein
MHRDAIELTVAGLFVSGSYDMDADAPACEGTS